MPAGTAEFSRHQFIARDVRPELPAPEGDVRLGCIRESAPSVAMPEASMDKHCCRVHREHDVRPAEDPSSGVKAKSQPGVVKRAAHLNLWPRPAGANARHHLTTARARDGIGHRVRRRAGPAVPAFCPRGGRGCMAASRARSPQRPGQPRYCRTACMPEYRTPG